MRSVLTLVFQLAVALGILLGGAAVFRHLKKTAPEIKKAEVVRSVQEVHFLRVQRQDLPIQIEAHGTLEAAQEVVLRSEVSGPVESLSPRLVPGQRVPAGEELLRVDGRDYRFALERFEAALEQAEQDLELEEGRHRIARKEWDLFQGDTSPLARKAAKTTSKSLALRLPQLAAARAKVASAKSAFEEAKLNLERTRIAAPFNAMVQAKRVEVGQHVTPQSELVHLVGTDTAWVELPLTPRQLARIRLPEATGQPGSRGTVSAELAGQRVERPARVLHLLPRVDQGVRFARILVEVQDPFRIEEGGFPLLLGAYCTVSLEGRPLEGVVGIPRSALRDRSRVFVLDAEDRLRTRSVETVWERNDEVWIAKGLEEGERLVVGHVPTAVDGTVYRPVPMPGTEETSSEPEPTQEAQS